MTAGLEEALRLVKEERPDLVLLDLMLPGTDGIELMRDILAIADMPVTFLSGYGRDDLIARAFDMGAIDYVVKPLSPTELVARIQTVMRRRTATASAEPSEPYVRGELTVNYADRRVYLGGRPVQMTDIEYRLLFELSVNAGRVMNHTELLQRVWRSGHPGNSGPVRTTIKNRRRKLGDEADNPTYILNEPRLGYGMEGEMQEQETE